MIAQLVESKAALVSLRVWVPGCLTGEEAYSIAMLIAEEFDGGDYAGRATIYATDVDRQSLNIAGAGAYPGSIAAVVSPERLQRFFRTAGDQYQVTKELRDLVVFAPQNLIADPPFSHLDLISCRNQLIYIETALQKKMIELIHHALNPGITQI